jgi:hypothetical protein
MGHGIERFLRTYSKRIDGGGNGVEMARLEGSLEV